jgi:hypothetical protein
LQKDKEEPFIALHGMTAVALSAAICHIAHITAGAIRQPEMSIPIATGIIVVLATVASGLLRPLASSANLLATILMQARLFLPGLQFNIPRVSLCKSVSYSSSTSFPSLMLWLAAGYAQQRALHLQLLQTWDSDEVFYEHASCHILLLV